jgi:UDP-N-acetylglucosamine transferase subunit ALG13
LKTIAYYISDYGYGHASRSIAIIRKILNEPNIKIIVCHSYALAFIKDSLNFNRVSYRNTKTDIGYFLEENSIHPDKIRIIQEYKNFLVNWNERMDQEEMFLQMNKVDLVISDISPLPFGAAERLGIPAIGISNFSWYTAYQGLIDNTMLDPFKEAYQKLTSFFALAGSKENWNVPINNYGFFSREIDLQEVQRIRQYANPKGNLKVVFLGLGMKIDVGSLNELPIWDSPNCVFLVSSNVQVNRPNVFQIPGDYLESQNFIAASDLVISKAGWGIIGEAISANVPLLILDRTSMKEDQNTIAYLKQHDLCETIDWHTFKTYQVDRSLIDRQKKRLKNNNSNNQVKKIAADLIRIVNNFSNDPVGDFNNYFYVD